MPYPTEHAARQRSAGSFVESSFRRYMETLPEGVALIMGQPKNEDRLQVQSVRFNAALWTPAQAKKWLKENEYKDDSFEQATQKNQPRAAIKGRYDAIDFTPPKSVAATAARGLELRAKAPPSQRGGLTQSEAGEQGIGSGVQRATNLKNRDEVSPETIDRMVAFFARHAENAKIDPKYKSEPHRDRGYVAHLLWGGDAGKRWAEKVKGQMDKADELKKAWNVQIPISKLNSDKRLAFGWASIIVDEKGDAVIDHQSDRISVPELEKAAYEYVQKSRQSTEMHVRKGVAELVESCVITPEKREAMGIDGKGVTGWWVGFRVNDAGVWDKVKSGDYSEFSIGGTAKRRSVDQ